MSIFDHATLAPSGAHMWAPDNGCRASVALQAKYPPAEDSPEAREGTAAHHYVTEYLLGRDWPIGSLAPNGHPINAEMVDAAQGLLIDVRSTVAAAKSVDLRIERRVTLAHHVHEQCWGTPDVVLIDTEQKLLHVWDYKYGHRFVDAARNWQLILYAIGVLEGEGYYSNVEYHDPRSFHGWRISFSIAQPRNYSSVGPIREWYASGRVLADYIPQLRKAAHEALQPGAEYRTGDHCRDCSGRHVCPALQRAGAIAMDVAMHAQPIDLPPHAVGLELRQIEDAEARLKARRTGLEEQALALIRGGTLVPFYSCEPTIGQERWNIPAQQVLALGEIFGASLSKDSTLTPKQARKLIPEQALEGMTEQPRGALRLVRVNDDAASLAFE